jgi:O-antigen/teichoic acid export membrane protein
MSRFSTNLLSTVAGQTLIVIAALAGAKYIFARLGDDAFGLIFLTTTTGFVLAGVFELGICTTIVKEAAAFLDQDAAYVHSLIRTASAFYWCTYVVLCLAIVAAGPYVGSRWIILTSLDRGVAVQVFRVLGVGALLAIPRSLYNSVLRGAQRMDASNLIDVSAAIAQQCGTIAILAMGGGILAVTYWLAGSTLLWIGAYVVVIAHIVSPRCLVPEFVPGIVKRNRSYTSQTMRISFFSIFNTQYDKLVMSRFLPVALVGYYGFAYTLLRRGPTQLAAAVAQAALPFFASLHAGGQRAELKARYKILEESLCFGLVPLFAAILYAAPHLFGYVFNRSVAGLLAAPAILLAAGFYMSSTMLLPYMFCLAVGRPDIPAKLSAYSLALLAPSIPVLVWFFGITGAAGAFVLYQSVGYAFLAPRAYQECLALPLSSLAAVIGKSVSLGCLCYGIWLVRAWNETGSSAIPETVAWFGVGTAAFVAGTWLFVTEDLRRAIKKHLRLGLSLFNRWRQSDVREQS